MPIAARNRKWHRLHALTWVVAFLAVGVLVLLVVPGAFAREGLLYGNAIYQHGWPWPFLEHAKYHEYGDEERVPWLLRRAWRFEGDVAWGLLAADAACAVGLLAAVSAAWEWRRRRRQRLWQVTLSELCLATVAIACGLGWWQTNAREAARQAAVADELNDAFVVAFMHTPVAGLEYRGPLWLYRLTGQRPDWLKRVTGVSLPAITDTRPPREDTIRLIATLTHVAQATLPSRVTISLADGDLEPLTALPRLSDLSLYGGQIGAKNGRSLACMRALRRLSLVRCRFSPAGLAELSKHRQIEELELESTRLSVDDLKNIAQMRGLTWLSLADAGVSDAGLAHLSQLMNLETLHLGGNLITDAGLRHLSRLTNLELLVVRRTNVTEVGCRELQRHLPQCVIATPEEWKRMADDTATPPAGPKSGTAARPAGSAAADGP